MEEGGACILLSVLHHPVSSGWLALCVSEEACVSLHSMFSETSEKVVSAQKAMDKSNTYLELNLSTFYCGISLQSKRLWYQSTNVLHVLCVNVFPTTTSKL